MPNDVTADISQLDAGMDSTLGRAGRMMPWGW